ncbi:MAG: NAD-dependent DNA ligase LigA [Oscillospiraceae bacterium]
MADFKQEMRQLIDKLNAASDAYYNGKPELMTDYEWDAGFDRLKKLEAESGFVFPDSPTSRVSEDDIAGRREPHEFPALSLAKTKKIPDLVEWAGGRPIWMSWKLDGLTLVATYDGGSLTKVLTRGNGHMGTNITHLAGAIEGIPGKINHGGHLVIRGEAVISYADFKNYLSESGEDYANPRNLASGSLTLKDPEEVKHRKIRWIPFTLVNDSEHEIVSWGERMDHLADLGFSPVDHEKLEDPTEKAIADAVDRWTSRVLDRSNPYPVDGLVITYDDTVYASSGSVTGHHATRGGYAFKWQDESADTSLDHIEWSCAASVISPVAVFSPVELEGSTVKRASLCNISECERLGIGGKGTEISVIKANKIIPKVIKVTKKQGEFEIPDKCPVCGAPTEVRVSPASGTKTLVCTNPACTAKQLKKFARFVSKPGMDMDGISEQTLSRFINLGWIKSLPDLFGLDSHREEISALDGFGEKSAANISASIERSRNADPEKVLYSLSIPLCGQDVAKRLLSRYSLRELRDAAASADDESIFSVIDGIGPEKSASVVKWFKDPQNLSMFDRLMNEITLTESGTEDKGSLCEGLTFVITGEVSRYRNRSELKKYIESQGGKVTGSVSRSTSYLVTNDPGSGSAKNLAAQRLGIPVISEDEFIARFAPKDNG